MQVDVADGASVGPRWRRSSSSSAPIDILVNNAGIDVIQPFLDSTEETWDRHLAVNLKGPINTCHAVVPGMIARGSGKIVNIGSDAGRVGSSGEAVYSATKGGVIAFTKTLAREVAGQGVNVNCVCPGPTDTALLDQVADGQPEAVRLAGPGHPAAPDRASPPTSPRRSRSSPATAPATSPARRCR